MNIAMGNLFLALALLAAAAGVLACMIASRFDSRGALTVARSLLLSILGSFTLAGVALLMALVDSDFRLAYVVKFTEKALPTGYKLAAFWAGQEGSILLWGWMIALFAAIATLISWKKGDKEQAVTVGTLIVICGFFAALMLFADVNPFTPVPSDQHFHDGQGLNPMLQDPGMIAHPPLLFLGYAGFAVPFAMMFGALWAGRRDNQWVAGIRRWTVLSWLFLSIGILLGAEWAYTELGWGGYWAWDPVENASLLPWLTGTALVHSIMVQQQRGMLKVWSAILVAVTFILCIFGTWITRSGVVQSVHSFGASKVGTFFFVFMIGCILGSVALLLVRQKLLRAEHTLETIWGREGLFMVTNVLLCIMTATTIVGTMLPAITGLFSKNSISVGQPFYNSVVVPMGLLLMAIMAIGPLLSYGKEAAQSLARRVIVPVIGGIIAAAALAIFWQIYNGWALASAFIVGVAVVSLLSDLAVSVWSRIQATHENPIVALLRTIDGNHRRYGGQTIHVGMLMMMIGIAGSSLFNFHGDVQLAQGTAKEIAGWNIRLENLEENRGPNYLAVEATVRVTDPRGESMTLKPQQRFYDKVNERQSHADVAIWSDWRRDGYLQLAGWENGGRIVALQLIVNPLVSWLWIGGIVLTAGGVLCVLPRLIPHGASVPVPAIPVEIPVSRTASRRAALTTSN